MQHFQQFRKLIRKLSTDVHTMTFDLQTILCSLPLTEATEELLTTKI